MKEADASFIRPGMFIITKINFYYRINFKADDRTVLFFESRDSV